MKTVFDYEAKYSDNGYWLIEAPIQNPYMVGVFDYISTCLKYSLQDAMNHAKEHLADMEKTYGVTFGMTVKKRGFSDHYDLKNEYDLLTMVLKYS
jgi:hypothetical protein